MPAPVGAVTPRTFFLNERHELSPIEKGGGGRIPEYVGISWAAKARRLSQTLSQALSSIRSSHDPLRDEKYFVLTHPVRELVKRSRDRKKAPEGTFKEPTSFGAAHGRVFDRLGLDLLQVTDDGKAVVHADRERIDQLQRRSESLESLGTREQARWVTIDSFGTVPPQLRFDATWLATLRTQAAADVVIELQPVLTPVQAERVLRAIVDLLVQHEGEKLTGTGTDFSGRYWFRGRATQRSIRTIAKDFFSVQSLHPPLFSFAAAKGSAAWSAPAREAVSPTVPVDASSLPSVAVVDLGVPTDHKQLAPYRRGQFYPLEAPRTPVGDHGAFVASRVVFGECQSHDELTARVGTCSFYDAMVGTFPAISGQDDRVDDMLVMDAIRGVRASAPDVRVFNLSFADKRPLHVLSEVERREKRLLVQHLDNFIFASDSLVIVAAGNSQPGLVPRVAYPGHHDDDRWALGHWASGFNTLVCGSFVGRVSPGGLVTTAGWPSPFTRIGPGICDAPLPSFGAEGGNTDGAYHFRPGLGVWGFSERGLPEDRIGTSHAAPILAREAAIASRELEKYCDSGTQPFAVTVRAFLTLTAVRTADDERIKTLAERTLGHGKASARRLIAPVSGSAVLIWQGTIASPNDTIRVQLPIPLAWLSEAGRPVLRLVVCYDPPVSEVAQGSWACRKVKAVLHLGPDARYLLSPVGGHPSYSVICREYNLRRYAPGNEKAAEGDLWLLELSYEEIAPYPPAMSFDPRQRVAFVAELIDRDEAPVDPQPAMQALPIAASMTRLSIQPAAIRSPIMVRTRVS